VRQIYRSLQNQKAYEPIYLNYSAHIWPIVTSVLIKLLRQCYQRRAKFIDVEIFAPFEWNITHKYFPEDECLQPLRFGLLLNTEFAYKQVEKCESDNPEEVHHFKQFWGEKCQLRRFRDGTMWESVVFDDDASMNICQSMLKYALKTHLSIEKMESVVYIHDQLKKIVDKKYIRTKFKPDLGNRWKHSKRRKFEAVADKTDAQKTVHEEVSSAELMTTAVTCFDDLGKMLRELKDLPLTITSVQGASSMLRFSNVYPSPPQMFLASSLLSEPHKNGKSLVLKLGEDGSLPIKLPKYVEPINIIVQLESSGKWPDDLKAISRLKCAFLIRIGELLKQQFGLVTQAFPRYLDVLKVYFLIFTIDHS